ncbi:MAG: signal recognition particle subunit SRP19/SEC65 family protein, partial [Thermoplasmata archaeon]|nr:signal recognition particle subunit SRP19/SEC65 family protein [Thermoplasmata archaeon]
MVSRGDRIVVLYPLYFDGAVSREDGRRVSTKVAVRDPTLEELAEAARRSDYRVEVEPGAAHPRRPAKREGRILIVGGGTKTAIVQAVA